jgi:nucleoside-diphosphate-sugar epimerase
MTIGVTGATGALGGRVAEILNENGPSVRLIVSDPSRIAPAPSHPSRSPATTAGMPRCTRCAGWTCC